MPQAPASNGCSQPKRPGPKWGARTLSSIPFPTHPSKSHNHCAAVLGSRVIGRAAAQLAASFDPDHIASIISGALEGPALSVLQNKLAATQQRTAEVLASLHLPHLPTRHES